MTRVKICGIKRLEDARAAIAAGADFLGFVFYRTSTRFVDPETACAIVATCRAELDGPWQTVAVFANPSPDEVRAAVRSGCFDWIQLSGEETPEFCQAIDRPIIKGLRFAGPTTIETVRADRYAGARYLLDANVPGRFGGTGLSFDWSAVAEVAPTCFLAGGLSVRNVGRAVVQVRPWGVDVSSGVERNGVKDPELIRAFVAEVRAVDRAS